ncbi:glucose-6-phosphate isomerase [Desulfurispirillum indicum]|uniref:Glucose-6-phosphate isomerase n=1 Tax=Desulfurispirillum indicum (strain ATCC BAA-1389 / DSM 22839 / S5) TaxID=653733 RepID=E6W5L6_DESIS|nr:glucose-6-phosphate isomerase [Desulfurispirillum indicum]ADU66047.1 phosphoglucose isomerase (PGI) [Desulfurispirillum indicum S5]UCZ55455.1 glucose-6-phosphate isomerase [Desulfurispirillum indicum]
MITIDYTLTMKENVATGLNSEVLEAIDLRFRTQLHRQLEARLADSTYAFRAGLSIAHDELPSIKRFLQENLGGMRNFVVVGIGGSNLGNLVLDRAFRGNGKSIYYLDNVEPDKIHRLFQEINLQETVFNIITKSGSTSETLANYIAVRNVLERKRLPLQKHLIFTTDPQKGYLQEIRQRDGIPTFHIPSPLGGRFSVLSTVGLLSSGFKGIDLESLLQGAHAAANDCLSDSLRTNKGLLLAALYIANYQKGRTINVLMPYSDRLHPFGQWFRQLWAESLGKINRDGKPVGQTPVDALGTVDQHSQVQLYMEGPDDKIITFIEILRHQNDISLDGEIDYFNGQTMAKLLRAQLHATQIALLQKQRCSLRIEMDELNEWNMGYLMYLYMYATVAAGELLGVNPIDQPGVEQGKEYTYALLDRPEYHEQRIQYEKLCASLRKYCV